MIALDTRRLLLSAAAALGLATTASSAESDRVPALIDKFCVSCHAADAPKGGLNLAAVAADNVARQPDVWEKVVRRLRGRQMPPAGKRRPDEETYTAVVAQLERALDRAAEQRPNPGRTDTLRRLNRNEYQNAVRD